MREITTSFTWKDHSQDILCWLCFCGRPGLLSGEVKLKVSTLEGVYIWILVDFLREGTEKDRGQSRTWQEAVNSSDTLLFLEWIVLVRAIDGVNQYGRYR